MAKGVEYVGVKSRSDNYDAVESASQTISALWTMKAKNATL